MKNEHLEALLDALEAGDSDSTLSILDQIKETADLGLMMRSEYIMCIYDVGAAESEEMKEDAIAGFQDVSAAIEHLKVERPELELYEEYSLENIAVDSDN